MSYSCGISGNWPNVYWSCGNGGGLHLGPNLGGFAYSDWGGGGGFTPLEVYVR